MTMIFENIDRKAPVKTLAKITEAKATSSKSPRRGQLSTQKCRGVIVFPGFSTLLEPEEVNAYNEVNAYM